MAMFLRTFIWTILFLGTALAAVPPPVADAAPQCEISQNLTLEHPLAGRGPTKVLMGIYVVDVMKIDDFLQSFTTDFILSVSWNDPRLSVKARGNSLIGCKLKPDDIWHPKISIVNIREIFKRSEDTVQIDVKGNVVYRQRYFGELSSVLDLREFPFDTQTLPISFVSGYSPDDVAFFLNESWTGRFEAFSIPGWSVNQGTAVIDKVHIATQERNLSRFDYNLSFKRHSGYYLWKVIPLIAFIVLMAGAVFLIDLRELGSRVTISTSAVLTLIIAQFTTGMFVPRIGYLTKFDKFFIGCTVLVFAALSEAVITSRLARRGREDFAQKINRWCYLLYALSFAMIIVYTLII